MMFLGLALLLLLLAHRVVYASQPLHSVVSLMGVTVGLSILWLWAGAEFLALALIFVYVGAVMTLFLFMVMMVNIPVYPTGLQVKPSMVITSLLATVGLPALLGWFLASDRGWWQVMSMPDLTVSNTAILGRILYTDYFWPFQLTGLVMLTAVIVAVGMIARGPRARKVQSISEQIAVDPKKRVRLC